MANIAREETICDKCGVTVYPYHRRSLSYRHYYSRISFISDPNVQPQWRSKSDDFDLCPECYEELREWIMKGKEPEKNEQTVKPAKRRKGNLILEKDAVRQSSCKERTVSRMPCDGCINETCRGCPYFEEAIKDDDEDGEQDGL